MSITKPYATTRNIKKVLKRYGVDRVKSNSMEMICNHFNNLIKEGKITDMNEFQRELVKFAIQASSTVKENNRVTINESDVDAIFNVI